MLVSANGIDALKALAGVNSFARGSQRANAARGSRLRGGLDISSLRATSAPSVSKGSSLLVQPPESGQGLLSQFQGQTRSVSPLTGRLPFASQKEDKPRSLGVLQASLIRARENFQKIDNTSRLLQAKSSPLRTAGGFGFSLFSSSLDLLG